jgi:taurine dioxygenase
MFSTQLLTGTLGAEVTAINLAEDLNGETLTKLQHVLAENKVLCFRDQREFGPQEQVCFGRRLGELLALDNGQPSVEGFPELALLSTESAKAFHPDHPVETWHCDVTCMPAPPWATVLRAVEVPPYGRDTMWADMAAVYDGLSSKVQGFLDGLVAVHGLDPRVGHPYESLEREKASTEHPVVTVHPVTGRRIVYVNQAWTTSIVGMREDESRLLLRFLFDQTRIPEYQVRISWRPNTVVMWDNRSTQHCPVFDRTRDARRIMHRIMVLQDKRQP